MFCTDCVLILEGMISYNYKTASTSEVVIYFTDMYRYIWNT